MNTFHVLRLINLKIFSTRKKASCKILSFMYTLKSSNQFQVLSINISIG